MSYICTCWKLAEGYCYKYSTQILKYYKYTYKYAQLMKHPYHKGTADYRGRSCDFTESTRAASGVVFFIIIVIITSVLCMAIVL